MPAIGTEHRKYTLPLARFNSDILPQQNRSSWKTTPDMEGHWHTHPKDEGNWWTKERSNLHNCWISLIALLLDLALLRTNLTACIFLHLPPSFPHPLAQTYAHTLIPYQNHHKKQKRNCQAITLTTQHTNFIKHATSATIAGHCPITSPLPIKESRATAICTLISYTLRQWTALTV